jgi:hypothetical protein
MDIAAFSLVASGRYINNCSYISGVAFSSVKSLTLLNKGNVATGTWSCTQMVNCTFTNLKNIGGRMLHVGSQNCTFTNHGATNTYSGITVVTYADYALEFTTGCNGMTIDGVDFLGLTSVQPYAGIVYAAASYNILVKNIGTYAAKRLLGVTATWAGVIFGSGGNNDGITLKRCYTTGTRTGLHSLVNSDTNILLENVYGDYADTTVMTGLNAIQKNCGLTSATTGQQSCYGTHWQTRFTSTTAGFVEILCNEPTSASAAQCAITAGVPQFNSAGAILATVIGQQVTWEMPFWAYGFTAFTNGAPTITGTNVTYSSGARWGNHDIEFQIDLGTGYGGTWLALTAANLTAQTISATTGFKLKLRVTCATGATTNVITNMRIAMTTTDAAQGAGQYPLSTNTLEFTSLQAGSEVRAYTGAPGTDAVEIGGIDSSGAAFSFTHSSGGVAGFVQVIATGFQAFYLPLTYSSTDQSIPVSQVIDRNYQP